MRDKIIYILILGLAIASLRLFLFSPSKPVLFEEHMGEKVRFVGIIIDEPSTRENAQHLVVEVDQKFSVLVSVPLYGEYAYGDEVEVIGVLKRVENFITDTGKEFDYINYLRKDGILYTVSYGQVRILSAGHGNKIKSILFTFKNKFLDSVAYAVPGKESILLGGLILGEKASFSDEDKEAFIRTGTIHIIALSGYNVSIVASWIMRIFAFAGFNASFFFGVFGIFLFVLMTGAPATAVRAGIMAVLALIARQTGRTYVAGRGLWIAGIIMIVINPLTLLYDISFQLSFIATFAVIYFTPLVQRYFYWVTPRFGLREVCTVTTSAYIFVLPFILYKMGTLSLVALPANFIVLPLIPLTMFFGFATGFLGLIHGVLSLPLGFVSYWLLHFEFSLIHFMSDLPFASITIPNFPLWLTLAFYLYFLYMIFRRGIKIYLTTKIPL